MMIINFYFSNFQKMKNLILILTLTCTPFILFSQELLEVDGKAKLMLTEVVNGADSVVVQLSDGTLALREVSSLTDYQVLSLSNDSIYLVNGGFVVLPPDLVDDADADPGNEIQIISRSDDTIHLSSGGFVILPPDLVDDADADPNNEIQAISQSGDTIHLSSGGFVILPPDLVDDADADPNNEIQAISQSGDTIHLSSGGFVILPPDLVDDADADPNNEIQAISRSDDTIHLSSGGFVILPPDLVDDADADPNNEIQTINKVDSLVTLSDGGGTFTDEVDDADADANNEIQNLSQVLSQGNDANNSRITSLADPVAAQDAVTKNYVDSMGGWSTSGNDIYNGNSGNVGVGTSTPSEKLEVDGAINIGINIDSNPTAGTIRWNDSAQDFEGYTGTEWRSLTEQFKVFGNSDINLAYNSTESNKLTASDPAEDHFFGYNVSIDGDYAIIGAIGDDDGGDFSGSAYIYHHDGTSWTEQAKLTAPDAGDYDNFGTSVSINGNYAIVGVPYDDFSGYSTGSADIFVRSDTSWTHQAKLTASDADGGDYFGYSVSISGDYAVIGAYEDNDGGGDFGSAYIFVRSDTTWSQQTKLTASDAANNDKFGYSVSISGDYAVIGANGDEDGGSNSGSAYIFIRTDTNWSQQAKLNASDSIPQGQFGFSVSISEEQAIIGSPFDTIGGSSSGSAFIFERTDTTWSLQSKLTVSGASVDAMFGSSVSISGNYAVVGAPYNDDGGSNSGSAFIFSQNGFSWQTHAKLDASDAAEADRFGYGVSTSRNRFMVGAYYDIHAWYAAGSVYTYE